MVPRAVAGPAAWLLSRLLSEPPCPSRMEGRSRGPLQGIQLHGQMRHLAFQVFDVVLLFGDELVGVRELGSEFVEHDDAQGEVLPVLQELVAPSVQINVKALPKSLPSRLWEAISHFFENQVVQYGHYLCAIRRHRSREQQNV